MPLWLSESDVHHALSMGELIDAMQNALAAFSTGKVIQPVRSVLEFHPRDFFALMPACDPEANLMGAKLVTVVPDNASRGLHSHQAIIALFDATTGALLAVTDGRLITESRTAAVSAVSARHLARDDAHVLAIIGTGVQARSHLEALPLVRDFQEVRVWSPNVARVQAFVDAAPCAVRAAASAEDAVRGADVVVLATSAVTPVIKSAWVADGTHVIGVGACRPAQRETEGALLARATVVVDSRAAAMVESGDILLAIAEGHIAADRIHGELGEIVAGRKPARRSPNEITFFKSLGLAIEDVVSAGLAYRRAMAAAHGTQVAL
jgi:ornithine cyclodeaminase/alanine dehydrogenase-like protein (mu-crystallin family)